MKCEVFVEKNSYAMSTLTGEAPQQPFVGEAINHPIAQAEEFSSC
jgi:hypothetical protein